MAELELALRTVAMGDRYRTLCRCKYAIEAYCERAEGLAGPLAKLSIRHREILQRIAEGQTTKDITQRLNLSVKTVETHRAQLMERIGIHDVPGLVCFTIRVGMIQHYLLVVLYFIPIPTFFQETHWPISGIYYLFFRVFPIEAMELL